MEAYSRIKRVTKELFGLKQWPKKQRVVPGSFEEQIYFAAVRPGDVCFDVGANIGEVSVFLAQIVGERGLVVAFEPVWLMYVQLCRQIQYDTTMKSPIVTIAQGLADCEKDSTIHVPNGKFGMGSMADAAAWEAAQAGASIESHFVHFTTIDSFLSKTAMAIPSFIKIDVEGAEKFVLYGASQMFAAGHRPLMLIEVFAPWEKAFGYGPWEPLSWLRERGYRFLFACPTGLVEHVPVKEKPYPAQYEMGYNILAYCPEMHAERIAAMKPLCEGGNAKLLSMAPPPQANSESSTSASI